MPSELSAIELMTIDMLSHTSQTIAVLIGYVGIIIIFVGCARGMIFFVRKLFWNTILLAEIRIDLGKYLTLGLEFLVGKDIIESLVEPTWNDLGKLGAIILLRTMLTRFLGEELKEVKEQVDDEARETKVMRRRLHS